MNRMAMILLALSALFLAACSGQKPVASASQAPPQAVQVSTAQVVTRTVPAAFDVTGTFAADETSDIATPVAGRVIATPVNVGDFVQHGKVVCELATPTRY